MRKLSNTFGLLLTVVVIGVLLSWAVSNHRPAVAADAGWVITSFHSDVDVGADSTLTVVEDIKVDFGNQQKHGIFRTIPLRYHFSDSEDRYYNLSVLSVTNGEEPVTYDAYVDSDNQVIKVGDPGTLVSGAQRYVITYSVFGAVTRSPTTTRCSGTSTAHCGR